MRQTKTAILTSAPPSKILTASEAMEFLDLTRSPFYDHVRNGVIPRCADGKFDSNEILKAYLLYLRTAAENRGNSAGEKLSIERARLVKEQTDKVAMDNARRRAELVTITEAIEIYSADLGELHAGLSVIPSKVGQECAEMTPAEIAQYIAQIIDNVLGKLR